jgi:hypothetical protein
MAGECTGIGIRINADNAVEADLDRREEWPYSVAVGTRNGLRGDPTTGQLWVPPDQIIRRAEATAPGKTVVPDDSGTVLLTELSLQMTASDDHDQVMFGFFLVGGYQGFRMGLGNFWAVKRYITTYDDGDPTTFSGSEEVGAFENNAGPSAGAGSIVEGMVGWAVKPGGIVFKVTAHYDLDPLTYTASPVNGFAWRPPRLQIVQFSMPQAT